MKQTKPTTVDDAIRATLDVESYSRPSSSGIDKVTEDTEEHEAVAATSVPRTGNMKLILRGWRNEWRRNKESNSNPLLVCPLVAEVEGRQEVGSRKCWNCKGEGHLARECPSPKTLSLVQENERPAALWENHRRMTKRLI